MSMYKLRRIINFEAFEAKDYESISMVIDKNSFFLSDSDMDKLKQIQNENEYTYFDFDNILHFDKTPHFVSKFIDNKDFIEDYSSNLNNKHYISYYYTYAGDM